MVIDCVFLNLAKPLLCAKLPDENVYAPPKNSINPVVVVNNVPESV